MGSNPAGSLFINFTEVILVQAWSGLVRPWELGCHCSANQVNDSTSSSQPETTSQRALQCQWSALLRLTGINHLIGSFSHLHLLVLVLQSSWELIWCWFKLKYQFYGSRLTIGLFIELSAEKTEGHACMVTYNPHLSCNLQIIPISKPQLCASPD